ncbi:hypothetical protein I4U23_018688 [Adineta vaga]|nr:hypothetical protein I4U23_018688 [Adineta vaga]
MTNTSTNNYDTNGAMLYIITVLLWYSVGVILILAMQMSGRSHEIEDSVKRRARYLIRNLSDHYNTQEILEELANKQNRDRLWKIYMGTNTKDCLMGAENVRIRHIKKQLATIKRNHRIKHDGLFPSTNEQTHYLRSRSEYQSDLSAPTSTLRRRSSFDQQALDRLKQFDNQSKSSETQLLWSSRKTIIRKYFRRSTKKPFLTPSPHTDCSVRIDNPEPMGFSTTSSPTSKLSRRRTEANISLITSTIAHRQNPYLSYFSIPSTRTIIS